MNIESLLENNQIIMSVDHAKALLAENSTGRMYIYHTGCLPNDRVLNQRLDRMARFLLMKSELGACNLFEKKMEKNNIYYYICQY